MVFLTLKKLLSMFLRLNLSSLPSTNPGNGQPWRHTGGSIVVGDFSGGAGGVTDHGALSGLGDDDHTQYFNASRLALVLAGYQPLDADLTAIGALAGTSGLLRKTAVNTWTLDTTGYLTANQLITLSGDATGSGSTAITLTLANSGVTAGTYRSVTVDAKGRVTAGTNPTTLAGYGITDAYTAAQVDALVQGLDPKASVRAATTANITLSAAQTIDGVSLVAGDRVLVKNQTTASQNGIYVVAAGAWTRATDMDVWTEVPGAYVFVEEGTTQADTGWVCTSNAGGTINTTAITWGQFAGAGTVTQGTGITVTGNQVSLASGVATPGTYRSVTVDTFGRVTAGTNPTTLAGYGITDAQPLDADLASLAAATATNAIFYRSAADTWTPVVIGANLTFVGGTLAATGGGSNDASQLTTGTLADARLSTNVTLLGNTTSGTGAIVRATNPSFAGLTLASNGANSHVLTASSNNGSDTIRLRNYSTFRGWVFSTGGVDRFFMNEDGMLSVPTLSVGTATIAGWAMVGGSRVSYTPGATLAGIQLVATGGSWFIDNRPDNTFQLSRGGSALFTLGTDGSLTLPGWIDAAHRPFTVAGLPLASANGGKTFRVTDATLAMTPTNYGSTPTGGGSNNARVYSTGSAWIIA